MICTWNRASTDNTDQIITHAEWLPIRRLFEPKAGKSHAANLGIQHATRWMPLRSSRKLRKSGRVKRPEAGMWIAS